MDDADLDRLDVKDEVVFSESTKSIEHSLGIVFRINTNAHPIFQVTDMQQIVFNNHRVGSPKTILDPIRIIHPLLNHKQIGLVRRLANIVCVNTNVFGHLLIFERIQCRVRRA